VESTGSGGHGNCRRLRVRRPPPFSGSEAHFRVTAASRSFAVAVVRGDLPAVPDTILLSRRTLAAIEGNLFWAFAYDTAAILLAALGCCTR
jgi:hypothetical protein